MTFSHNVDLSRLPSRGVTAHHTGMLARRLQNVSKTGEDSDWGRRSSYREREARVKFHLLPKDYVVLA